MSQTLSIVILLAILFIVYKYRSTYDLRPTYAGMPPIPSTAGSNPILGPR